MVRTAIPLTFLSPAVATVQPAATAIDQANGMVIANPATSVSGAFPRPGTFKDVLLIVNNTTVSGKSIIFRAGVTPPAHRASIGDLSLALLASTTYYIPGPDLMRFSQIDGSINVDFTAATTGTILAVVLPIGEY